MQVAKVHKAVDDTATASVGHGDRDDTPRAAIKSAWAQAEADAEWARISATQSASLLFFGRPERVVVRDAEPLPTPRPVAFDAARMPFVMRGGISGGLFPEIVAPSSPATTAAAPAATDGQEFTAPVPLSPELEADRAAQRAREREARPSAPRPRLELSPREQSKILPN